jgi:cell division protein FtsW
VTVATRSRRPAGGHDGGDRRPGTYLVLLALFVALNVVGLVMVLSASSVEALHEEGSSWRYFNRQAVWVALGGVVLAATMRIDYRSWRRWTGALLAGSFLLLVLVLVPGVGITVNGATRWLGWGPIGIQPSEIAKLALLLWTANLMARRERYVGDPRLTLVPTVLVLGVFAGLVLAQPNLGTTLVLGSIVVVVLFVAGVPLRPLGVTVGFGAAAALVLAMGAGYRRARLTAFLDPWADPGDTGYQTIQSLVGVASGGLSGTGLGASRAKWGFLPYAHTDFIFAIISEELGLIGGVLVVGLFVALGVLGVRAALHAPDRFGMLVAGGITAWFLVQAFVNIGAVIAVLPITGVPLPFVSFGGSSLLVSMAAAGILLNVARQAG